METPKHSFQSLGLARQIFPCATFRVGFCAFTISWASGYVIIFTPRNATREAGKPPKKNMFKRQTSAAALFQESSAHFPCFLHCAQRVVSKKNHSKNPCQTWASIFASPRHWLDSGSVWKSSCSHKPKAVHIQLMQLMHQKHASQLRTLGAIPNGGINTWFFKAYQISTADELPKKSGDDPFRLINFPGFCCTPVLVSG